MAQESQENFIQKGRCARQQAGQMTKVRHRVCSDPSRCFGRGSGPVGVREHIHELSTRPPTRITASLPPASVHLFHGELAG
jgi:hypothetical protein